MPNNCPADVEINELDSEVMEKILKIISKTTIGIDCFFNSDFSAVIDPERLLLELIHLRQSGLKLRLITDISMKDISFYREIVKYFDVRHLDLVACNIILVDGTEFLAYLSTAQNKTRLLHVSDQSFVSAQRFLFDSIWRIALPFKEKIKEIEYGHEKSFTNNITKPLEILGLIRRSITSSIEEILVLFSEYEVLTYSEEAGILNLLQDATSRGIKVRVIVYSENNRIKDKLKVIFNKKFPNVSVQYLQKALQTKMTTMIFDRRTFLDISTVVKSNQNFERIIGPSVYSNNEIKISSLISIFEFLWIQSDIDNQKIIKEVYFQLFKGFNLQDESYKRNWTFETDKQQK